MFFFCCGPGERQGKEKPRWKPARGQSKKKNTTQGVFFFAAAPAKGKGRWTPRPFGGARTHCGLGRFRQGRMVLFFCCGPAGSFLVSLKRLGGLWPRAGAQRGFSLPCLSPGPEPKKKHPGWCFFFLLWPRAGFQRGFSFPCLSPGPPQKKTPWVVFFLLWPRAGFQRGFSFPCLSPGPQQKKSTLGGVFFFAAAPRGRSLTHCGPGWRCLPLAGAVFFFFAAAPPGPGWCFFFCCGPARTLTHSRWAGAISARPGWCFFFCCGPGGSF